MTPYLTRYPRAALAGLLLLTAPLTPAAASPETQIRQAGLSQSLAPAEAFSAFGRPQDTRSFSADALLLETVLSYGPVDDPRPVFLLANNYITTNQQRVGLAFFETLLDRYQSEMTDGQKAVYLSAYALLRATHADNVFLLSRIGWVNETFDILDEARAAGGPNHPLVTWASGLIYAQVPWFFGKEDAALEALTWLAEHPETEPEPGFYREAYRFLSRLHAERGEEEQAARYLKISGYDDYEPGSLFMGWFAASKKTGLLFSPMPWIEEIVPGRIFAMRGFGFSEIHFIVSEDRKHLITIDAGTQPFSMEAAHDFLRANHPGLPPLTTAFITHAHWDHIGGYTYLKSLDNPVTVYGRENYHSTLERVMRHHSYEQFRSSTYTHDWVAHYHPDIAVDKADSVEIGGTRFDLIPATGGETEDNLLIHLPEFDTLFIGDSLMPFNGEPWVEEGFIDELIEVMDTAIDLNPRHVLHGHYALNYLYSAEKLPVYRDAYAWLVTETRRHLKQGYSAKEIIRLNLVPPMLRRHPEAVVSFAAPRSHVINRIADQMLGIWQENHDGREPEGLDVITLHEYGRMLRDYMHLSEAQVKAALSNMIEGGDLELALQMAVAAEKAFPGSDELAALRRDAADRLRATYQFLDPFKFVVYTEMAGQEHPGVDAPTTEHQDTGGN